MISSVEYSSLGSAAYRPDFFRRLHSQAPTDPWDTLDELAFAGEASFEYLMLPHLLAKPDVKGSAHETEIYLRQFRRAAEHWADDLTADRGQLQNASKQFKTLRDRWIAHNEVEWDSVNQTFRPPISAVSELYPALSKVVRIIDRAIAHMTRLVSSGEMKQRKFKRELTEISAGFWNLGRPRPSASSPAVAVTSAQNDPSNHDEISCQNN